MTPTDAPYFYDAQVQLLRRGAPIVLALARREPVSFTADPGPTASPLRTTDRVTFRHSGADGSATDALVDLLMPYHGVALERTDGPVPGGHTYHLAGRIVGDSLTCHARHDLAAELAGSREAVAWVGEVLLRHVADLLVERIFTGQR